MKSDEVGLKEQMEAVVDRLHKNNVSSHNINTEAFKLLIRLLINKNLITEKEWLEISLESFLQWAGETKPQKMWWKFW